MDGLLIGTGIMMLIGSIPAIFRPHTLVRESLTNRDRRLKELEDGAPERYFEERRELESYTPRFDFSDQTIRKFGFVALVLGTVSLLQGITQ